MSTKLKEKYSTDEVETLEANLIVFNDDVNSFEHVIDTLISVLRHTPEQAEQCTLLIHHKGKCKVKSGEYEELVKYCSAILDRGISAEIQ